MKKVCLNCGCQSFISDRSLGGKIVCKRCGSSSITYKGLQITKNRNLSFLIIIVVVFLLIIIL